MNILSWILFGLVAGAIAKMIMPGKDPGGWIVTILIGIGGSFIGGFIGRSILGIGGGTNEFSFANLAIAVLGALLLLGGYRFVKKKQALPK